MDFKLLTHFIDLLNKELGNYSSLYSLLQKEKRAVVQSKLDNLNEINIQKEIVLHNIKELEDSRLQLKEEIAEDLNCPFGELTITKLCKLADEPLSSRLQKTHSEIKALGFKIQEINNINKSLIAHSIELIRNSLGLLNNATSPKPVYYRSGKMQLNNCGGKILSSRI